MYRQGLAAAARLRGGIGLGALRGDHQKKEMMMRKISSSFSDDQFFIRRRKYSSSSSSSSSSAAAASMETKEDSLKGKYLHLCFCEHVEPSDLCTRDVVRSIKLSDLLSSTTKDDEDDAVNQIEQEAYNKSTGTLGNPLPWAYCRLGSQILFARGSTSRVLRMRFQLEEPVRGKILTFDATSGLTFKTPNFTLPRKHHRQFPTALLEVDRKLYCLDTRSQQYYSTSSAGDRFLRRRYPEESPPAFAVLDPAVSSQGEGEWLPLESPPPGILYHDDNFGKLNKLMYCTVEGGESGGSKILVWNPDKAGVCYFDVSQPKKGWIELHSPLATSLPFVKGCWGDTANLNHPPGTLIFTHQSDFTYYGTRTPDQSNNISVQVLLMCHNLDSLQALNPPLQLDQIIPIPPEFLNDRSLGSANGLTESCLVHLGGQKVCLILHKYFYSLFFTDEIGEELFDDSGRNKGILRLITFEYEVTPNLDIQCRFLTARNFEYYTKLPNNEYETHTALASLTKAFVM